MGIRKGEDWGTVGRLPSGCPLLHTDRELAELVGSGGTEISAFTGQAGLLGGDLCRTLGGTGDPSRLTDTDVMLVPIDAMVVSLDGGRDVWAVAHVVARGRWWSGTGVAVMNAAWMGEWNLAPAAHPGDGRVDVVHGSLPWRDRLAARRRARTGTHLPHPGLSVRKQRQGRIDLGRRVGVWVDGHRVGSARYLAFRVVPDACVVGV